MAAELLHRSRRVHAFVSPLSIFLAPTLDILKCQAWSSPSLLLHPETLLTRVDSKPLTARLSVSGETLDHDDFRGADLQLPLLTAGGHLLGTLLRGFGSQGDTAKC